ncbi:hypothetical protein Fmac_019065 [Flemingia macrophylla]|uniref:Uncharacterized protein n=1 Tax=Flemingia macrophylla TaxID=520843 RepID=A0ABD1M6S9_9FABA
MMPLEKEVERFAENIQDAYADTASFVEQVMFLVFGFVFSIISFFVGISYHLVNWGSVLHVGIAGQAVTEEQKIRLSIARVVLLNPYILLLEEVTGGLDFE